MVIATTKEHVYDAPFELRKVGARTATTTAPTNETSFNSKWEFSARISLVWKQKKINIKFYTFLNFVSFSHYTTKRINLALFLCIEKSPHLQIDGAGKWLRYFKTNDVMMPREMKCLNEDSSTNFATSHEMNVCERV